MIILKSHAQILENLGRKTESSSLEDLKKNLFEIESELEERLAELIAQNLVIGEAFNTYNLTYSGRLVVKALKEVEGLIGRPLSWSVKQGFLDPEITYMLQVSIRCQDRVAEEWKEVLEKRGLAKDGKLTEPAKLIYEAYKLGKEAAPTYHSPFNITLEEVQVLFAIATLWEKYKENRAVFPERAQIEKYLTQERKIPEHELYRAKKFDVTPYLYALESLNLVESRLHETEFTVYVLTRFGELVLRDQKVKERSISSRAVKSTTFKIPVSDWYKLAIKEGLLSKAGVTDSGLLYSKLAREIKRKPHLTKLDYDLLGKIPLASAIFISEVVTDTGLEKSKAETSLDKLEALGITEVLGNNAIILTPGGRLLKKAVDRSTKLVNPITPNMIKILKAIIEVGGQKHGKKIQIKDWKAVEKRVGLDPKLFRDEVFLLEQEKYIDKGFLTEAGRLLLEAAEAL